MTNQKDKKTGSIAGPDVGSLVQKVLRECYQEATEDLRGWCEKVRYFNRQKMAIRSYLASLRKFKSKVMSAAQVQGVSLCSGDENDLAILAKLFEENAQAYAVGDVEYELCIPGRVPRGGVSSFELLEDEIAHWEEQLATVGDDAQLANVDLQSAMQKATESLQACSNISKALHDARMAIIRNLGE